MYFFKHHFASYFNARALARLISIHQDGFMTCTTLHKPTISTDERHVNFNPGI